MQTPIVLPLFAGTRAQLLQTLRDLFVAQKRVQIATVNAEFCVDALSRSDFADVLQHSLCVIDSFGVRWAAARESYPQNSVMMLVSLFSSLFFGIRGGRSHVFPEVVPGADFVVDLCELAAREGYSVAFL